MSTLQQVARRLERLEALDKVAKPPGRGGQTRGAAAPGAQPAQRHRPGASTDPVLTGLPIGAQVMLALLDALGGPAAEGAADLLVTAGVVAAVPTSAAGLND